MPLSGHPLKDTLAKNSFTYWPRTRTQTVTHKDTGWRPSSWQSGAYPISSAVLRSASASREYNLNCPPPTCASGFAEHLATMVLINIWLSLPEHTLREHNNHKDSPSVLRILMRSLASSLLRTSEITHQKGMIHSSPGVPALLELVPSLWSFFVPCSQVCDHC